jgi:hypothetical protein
MAVGIDQNFEGATLDQYDQILEKMGFKAGGTGPAGCIAHFCTQTDNGMRVVDIWESKDQFDKFAEEQIGPLSAEVGLPNPPTVEFIEVHNYLTSA